MDLRDHLLARVKGLRSLGIDHEFTDSERLKLSIKNDTIYWHQTMRINYTTYDVRREQCVINPKRQADIMMYSSSPDSKLPYSFARVEGIFRVKIYYSGTSPPLQKEMDVLWVRWYGLCNEDEMGWENRRLPAMGFMDETNEDWPAYGFVDPEDVIRTMHLIPNYRFDPDLRPGQNVNPFLQGRATVEEYDEYYLNW